MPEARTDVDDKLLQELRRKIERGRRILRLLPGDGRIMMDRPLPFLCIYRAPHDPDPGVAELVRAQTSYLWTSDAPEVIEPIREVLSTIITEVAKTSKAFMLVEIWPGDRNGDARTFKAFCPANNLPTTSKVLHEGLNELASRLPGAQAEVVDSVQRHPPHLRPLFSLEEMKKMSLMAVGIEVPPVYWTADGHYSKLAMRAVRTGLTDVIKRAIFDFIRVQTPLQFPHYLTLGRTTITRSTLNIDHRLARIAASFDLLLNVSPVNTDQAWESFKSSGGEKPPEFKYRLISVDPEAIKRQLFNLRIGEVEDNALEFIFRDKRNELETQLTLLADRGTPRFLYSSLRLYGGVETALLRKARRLARALQDESAPTQDRLDATAFAQLVKEELDRYRVHFPRMPMGVRVRNDVDGVLVSHGQVHISDSFSVPVWRAHALIQHEVGTHVLTYCNGQRQPLKLLALGLAGYDHLQEGLAVLAEYLCGGLRPHRLKLLAARVIAVDAMVNGATFIDCHRLLMKDLGFTSREAFAITTRVFRGKGLAKDAAYLRGLDMLLDHLRSAPDQLALMYTGKFGFRHLKLIEDLRLRGVLKQPVMPLFLDDRAHALIEALKQTKGLEPLLQPVH